eukprot:gene11857-2403_t
MQNSYSWSSPATTREQDDHEENAPVDSASSWVTGADGNVPTTGKNFISAKGETRLGYWNARTLSEPSRVVQLAEVFNEKRLDLLGVTETHLPGSSKLRASGKTLLLSGRKYDTHRQGVGLMLSLKAEKCLTEWEPINERFLRACFKTKHDKATVVVCFAPTETSKGTEKDEFYNSQNMIPNMIPKYSLET